MGPIGDTDRGWHAAAQNSAARRLALQKPSAASRLAADSGGDAPPEDRSFQNPASENLRHSGTAASVPFRHAAEIEAPRLTPAFVAQLLGQILPASPSRPLDAGAAYKTGDTCFSLLLDRRL
jgi:hypothetical protein